MGSRLGAWQRLRRRVNRRFYRCLFRLYRTVFPTATNGRAQIRASSLSRVLVIRPDRIGDMIVTTPVLGFLADAAPGAQIDVLASRANAPVLEADARVHEVFVRQGWRDWVTLFPRMRRRRYDAIYSLIYGKGLREGLMASFIAQPETRKISVIRPARYAGLFTRTIRVPRSVVHMANQLLYVVRQSIDVGRAQPASYSMHIAIDSAAEAAASAFLATHDVGDFVVVNIAAAEPWRDWPPGSCASVLCALLAEWPAMTFVLTPPPGKVESAEQVVRDCASRRVILLPPARRFLDFVALVARARLVVTPDTANVHVASACHRPIVALYSLITTPKGLWSPFGVPARIVEAPPGEPVSAIAPAQIVRACEELFAETAPLFCMDT